MIHANQRMMPSSDKELDWKDKSYANQNFLTGVLKVKPITNVMINQNDNVLSK